MSRFSTGVAAVLGVVLLLGGCDRGTRPAAERLADGPLPTPPGHTAWFVVRGGEVFSDGLDILESSKRIRIDDVSILGDDEGAPAFLGARLGLPGRPDDFNQRMEGFPPAAVPGRFQVEAVGAELAPGKTYMLILGFRVAAGRKPYVREGVRIDYTAGDVGYTTVLDSRVVLCPRPLTEDACSEMFPAKN